MGEGPAPAAAGESRSAVAAGFTVLFVSTGVNFAFPNPVFLAVGARAMLSPSDFDRGLA